MGLLGWVNSLWYWQQRRDDLRNFWPVCLAAAQNIDEARAVFALHAYDSPAWLCLPPEELTRRIYALEDTRPAEYVIAPAAELLKPTKPVP